MNDHKCAEIQYLNEDGWVHSDLCWAGKLDDEYKQFLMDCFKEFLDKFDGENGHFVVNTQEIISELDD